MAEHSEPTEKAVAAPSAPSSPSPGGSWAGGFPDRLDVLWGLFSMKRTAEGEERIELLWGMLDIRTKRPRPVDPSADTRSESARVAEQRVDVLRAAAVFGSLAVGFVYLAFLSDGFFRGVWSVAGVVLGALAGGQVLSLFAERFRDRFLAEEQRASGRRAADDRQRAGRYTRDLQELTASIAHEIRNPITAAKSLVQQMGEDPGSDENVEYAQVALEELLRVERSVSHLLRFARDEEVTLHDMELREVVRDALSTLDERSKEQGASLRLDADTEAHMRGDAEKLRRVVLNLVGNSLDSLRDGTPSEPRVDVALGENLAGTDVWLRVRDNGPGIPEAEREKIFQPFVTSKEGGTGLGLAITKKIVEAHGGVLEVRAAPSGGAEFLASLPRGVDSA